MRTRKGKKGKQSNKLILIAVLSVIIVLGAIFTFVPMQFGSTLYTGVWGSINVSSEVYSGLYAEYDIKGEASKADITSSMETIKQTLAEQGYQSNKVLSIDGKKIRVEIGYPTTNVNGFASAHSALSSVAVGAFEFRSASSGTDYKLVSAKDHIDKMSVGDYNGTTFLTINFNKEGEVKFKELCAASSTIYVYMGKNLQTSFNASNVQDYSQMQLSITDYSSAKDFYYKAKFGSIKVDLNADTAVINTMTSHLGLSTTEGYNILFWLLVALVVTVIIAGFAFIAFKFKVVALLLMPAFLLDAIIAFWIFAGVNVIEINLSSLLAFIVGISLIFTGTIGYMSRISEEYKAGKTIDASILAGTKKARSAMIVTSSILIVIFALLSGIIKNLVSVNLILFVCSLLGAITNIVLLPWFVSIFNKSNKKQGEPFGFKQIAVEESQND